MQSVIRVDRVSRLTKHTNPQNKNSHNHKRVPPLVFSTPKIYPVANKLATKTLFLIISYRFRLLFYSRCNFAFFVINECTLFCRTIPCPFFILYSSNYGTRRVQVLPNFSPVLHPTKSQSSYAFPRIAISLSKRQSSSALVPRHSRVSEIVSIYSSRQHGYEPSTGNH